MKRSLLVILCLLCSANAFALGDPIKNEQQIVGCWKRRIYSDDVMKNLSTFDFYDSTSQKYQWFCFGADGVFGALTINKDAQLTTRDIENYRGAFPPVMTWKFVSAGVVRIEHKDDPRQNANWLISVATAPALLRDGAPTLKGDLFMGLLNRQGNGYALLRVLSKVE